jgi:hypothetical protein
LPKITRILTLTRYVFKVIKITYLLYGIARVTINGLTLIRESKMLNRMIFAAIGFVALFVLNKTDALTWVGKQAVSPLAPGQDDMPYARRMAEYLVNTPDCARFKQAILEAGKGPPSSGATKTNIINAYEEAKKNGCRKP